MSDSEKLELSFFDDVEGTCMMIRASVPRRLGCLTSHSEIWLGRHGLLLQDKERGVSSRQGHEVSLNTSEEQARRRLRRLAFRSYDVEDQIRE